MVGVLMAPVTADWALPTFRVPCKRVLHVAPSAAWTHRRPMPMAWLHKPVAPHSPSAWVTLYEKIPGNISCLL